MMLEEHVTSEMLELNGRKEAAIFKLIGEESEGGYYNAVNAGANTLPEVHYSKFEYPLAIGYRGVTLAIKVTEKEGKPSCTVASGSSTNTAISKILN